MKKKLRLDLLKKLGKKRKDIDLMDRKLLFLLNQRFRIALEIGKIKKVMGEKIYNPKREREILERLKIKSKGPLREEDLRKVFRMIMRISRNLQKN